MKTNAIGLLAAAFLWTTIGPTRALSQSQSSTNENQELRKLVEKMQAKMDEMQAEIDQLKGAKAQAPPPQPATAALPPRPAVQEDTIQSTEPPAQGATSGHVGSETASRQQFGEDKVAVARFDNVPLDPKYSGFFLLPGTQTILKIGGYFKSDSIHDLKPAGNTDAFVPSSFPVPQVPGVYNSTISIRPTRINLDFRILNTREGDIRFYVETDFFGTPAASCVCPSQELPRRADIHELYGSGCLSGHFRLPGAKRTRQSPQSSVALYICSESQHHP